MSIQLKRFKNHFRVSEQGLTDFQHSGSGTREPSNLFR
jgi:hypothetical protein